MTMRVVRTPLADSDLNEIWAYIARDNPAAANGLVRAINETIERIAENPDIGIRDDDFGKRLLCKAVRKKYLVFYECAVDEIRIVRILHGSRQIRDLL